MKCFLQIECLKPNNAMAGFTCEVTVRGVHDDDDKIGAFHFASVRRAPSPLCGCWLAGVEGSMPDTVRGRPFLHQSRVRVALVYGIHTCSKHFK